MSQSEQVGDDFQVPEFDRLKAVWGADEQDYLTSEQMGREFYRMTHPMCRVASGLFFKGGRLADHGVQLKAGIDKAKAMTAVQAWLCSFAPKHEIKIGTVGYALSRWCEPLPSD